MTILRNFLTCSALFLALPAAAQVVYLHESDGYNGAINNKSLEPKITCYPEGTSYIFLDDVRISNVKHDQEDAGVFINRSGNLFFMGNRCNFTFHNLMTEGFGAAISNRVGDTTLTLSNFSYLAFTSAPLLPQGQGAIYSLGSVMIENSEEVTFCGNYSSWSGAAIYTPYLLGSKASRPSVNLSGNRYLVFRDNVSQGYGGAISTHNLTLTTRGPSCFENNHAYHDVNSNGGAIAIAPGGSISISVKSGDLIFKGNTASQDGNTIHNSIHLQSGAQFKNLRAVSESGVYFYDPISHSESHKITDLVINAPEGKETYEGTISFSGLCLDDHEVCAENLTSTILQDVTLAGGTLSLSDGVTLQLHSFKQEASSTLTMSPGTTLLCSGDARVQNLHILIEDTDNFVPVRIRAEDKDALVSLEKLKVAFEAYWSVYDFPQFKEAFTIPLLELLGPSFDSLLLGETTLERTQVTTENDAVRGFWSLSWEEYPPSLDKDRRITPTKKTVFLTWNPEITSTP
ncbi:outer membrane protein 13 [Chlamydia pneumoniae TW-183]|uniref:Probable outer membrane protein pmp12 n=2 Tax=Chlamydia pneumoniae TaxID=83558 RepID=PMP12_CHLPN|nr:polymorphic outer membrane protein middle domain-containing protein [Chlamydia pneumoniae]Q9Z3D6.1 RecName: Full=Probable outer membrane protein pmp12; AltName: Full=Outer membrane protein 13; AltName: Full=Polymorphic membrane protein 12; Flags: Precursor [Chlamydia pneumoniae]AAD18594.1 Polymorphic Outer Membrane Protein (truncated) A/I Family [Chlamydia pneumoniae CWL029]AAF38158.1 polymorphic membrane protein G family [Chlamydia pneumoniae AR39]AAP98400.1 outer membrane protein 13 [Chlam